MGNDADDALDRLWTRYREACPDPEPSLQFMPQLWSKIEARQGFLFSFEHVARFFAAASAVMCLLLVLLDYSWASRATGSNFSYPDALAANHSPEQTFYGEGVRPNSLADDFGQ